LKLQFIFYCFYFNLKDKIVLKERVIPILQDCSNICHNITLSPSLSINRHNLGGCSNTTNECNTNSNSIIQYQNNDYSLQDQIVQETCCSDSQKFILIFKI
jgi:hypothetical protein